MDTTKAVERYRQLFQTLNPTYLYILPSQIPIAREAAKNPSSWRNHFLSKTSTDLRSCLSLAMLNAEQKNDDERYEFDQGMLEGEEDGYTSFETLLQDEKQSSASAPPFDLLEPFNDHHQHSGALNTSSLTASLCLIENELDRMLCIDAQTPQQSQLSHSVRAELQKLLREVRNGQLQSPSTYGKALQLLLGQHDVPNSIRRNLQSCLNYIEKSAQDRRERNFAITKADGMLRGLLSASTTSDATPAPASIPQQVRKRPRAPTFNNSSAGNASSYSLVEKLGLSHPIVKNVYYLRHIRVRRAAILAKLLEMRPDLMKKEHHVTTGTSRGRTTRPRSRRGKREAIDILNDVERAGLSLKQDRFRATSLSACALLLGHVGFTHSSKNALNLMVDVVEQFVTRIGASLSSCRENVDNDEGSVAKRLGKRRTKTRDEAAEELRIICESGFKSGLPELLFHVKWDFHRTYLALQDTEDRLKQQIRKDKEVAALFSNPEHVKQIDMAVRAEISRQELHTEATSPANSDIPLTEDDIKLNEEPFIFGYLCDFIRLDVLGGIQVPGRLVNGKKSSGKESNGALRIDRFQRSPRSKGKLISAMDSAASPAPLETLASPVKPELKFMDVSDTRNI